MSGTAPHLVDADAVTRDGWDGFRWQTLISADRTPTGSITQGLAELAPASFDPRLVHRHVQAETYYVLSGKGVLWIEGEEHALAPNTAAFIPGNARHATYATGEEPLRILYTFAADSFADVAYEFPEL